ncbi:MAG: NAD(P)/FAD-dependent oxidoreductase [Chloroflexi bacterium]|jgi:prolycopene isomerase|nr:NAD(P)/FAD-dependent oxidoreductase [Chloroflexota bacterium]
MAEKYDAIVVGAGIGGLAAALMLSHRGRKTLLLEKHRFLGGRLSSFDRRGFHVDLGVHLISRSDKGPTGDVLRRVGIPDPIQYIKVRPRSSYQGKVLTFPHDFKEMVSEKDFNGLMNFLGEIRFMPEEKMKEYDDVYLQTYLSQYTEEPMIHGWVESISGIYTGSPISLASTGEFMRCFKWEAETRASGYPDGGCSAISDAYGDGIRKFGGEIKLGAEVQKIEVGRGSVNGVMVGDEVYQSDVVVSNADIKNTVLNLVGADHFQSDYVDYVKGLRYSGGGATVVRIALDKKLTDIMMLGHIATFDREAYAKKLQSGIIPDELGLMVVVPSNFSTKVAPEGKQLICVVSGGLGRGAPKELKEALAEAIINTTESIVPGLRQHTLWTNTMTPDDLANTLGEDGAGIGIAQIVGQVGDKRPKIKTPIEGLYIVGGEAGGTGVGIELCINSAIEFMDEHFPLA